MAMDTKKMIKELALPDHLQWDSFSDALERAATFLATQGEPLSEFQKTAIGFAIEVTYRNDSDTWDHEFCENTSVDKNIARLLRIYLDD